MTRPASRSAPTGTGPHVSDRLLAALLDPRFHLTGDEDGGVSLGCSDCFDGGKPLTYYDPQGHGYPDPTVPQAANLPALWEAAARHLAEAHTTHTRPPHNVTTPGG